MSTELIERADQILGQNILPDRHSYFQLEKFVIGKEVTAQSQLWQIIREIDARRETIDVLQTEIIDAEDQLELFEVNIERINLNLRKLAEPVPDEDWYDIEIRSLEIKVKEINIRKVERKRDSLVKSAKRAVHKLKSIMEEMNCLIAAYDKLIGVVGECKPFDDRESQREMWNEKFLEEYNLRALLNRPLDPDFVKSIMALDDDASVKVHTTQQLSNIQAQIVAQKNKQIQNQAKKGKPKNVAPQEQKRQAVPPPPKPKQKVLPKHGGVFQPNRGPNRPKAGIVSKKR